MGHERMPFLSTQQRAVTEASTCSRFSVRSGASARPSSASSRYGRVPAHLPQNVTD